VPIGSSHIAVTFRGLRLERCNAGSTKGGKLRIIVVEDDPRLGSLLREGLVKAGFAVDLCECCSDAAEALSNFPYDTLVLDLGPPDGDGFQLCREARRRGCATPVLMLTARDAVDDRIAGLNAGADDYLTKPFAMAELVARIKTLLRQPGGTLGVVLSAGNIAFDTIGRDLRVCGSIIAVPRREVALLEHLLRRQGRVVPRAILEEKLYGIDDEPESNAIPVHIHRLRKRLEEAGARAEIHTVRGVGYVLMEQKP
jgi:DNA-binding response OmpR family regulator